jgi:CRISPR type I-E-associated protein CasB/Cse2
VSNGSNGDKKYLKLWEKGEPTEAAEILIRWHAALQDDKRAGKVLRRSVDPGEALQEIETVRLLGALSKSHFVSQNAVARLAMALAWIKKNDERPLGVCLAAPANKDDGGKGKMVSEQRVRMMIASPDADTFVRLLRSNVTIIGRTAPILHTANAVNGWTNSTSRAWLRRDIMVDYLGSVISQQGMPA